MAKIGKLHGVEAIVIGSISQLGNTMKVTAKLINTETAKLIDTADCNISNFDGLERQIEKVAIELAKNP